MSEASRPRSSGSNWKDLRPRLISAVVLILVAGSAIWAGGPFYEALILLAMCGLASEMATLFGLSVRSWRGVLYLGWAVCAGLAACAGRWSAIAAFPMTAFLFGTPLWLGNAAIVAAGSALLWLRLHTLPGAWSVVFPIAVVVASDSSAYLVGRLVGGPKLAPRISPGKTRSGAVGGLCGAVLAGMLVASLAGVDGMMERTSLLVRSGVWAALLGVVAQAGDLAESAVKRARGVKDSGTLLPGHGGLLDRFDAMLAVMPLAAVLSLAAQPGFGFWTVGLADLVKAISHVFGQ
ncbi:phosphatidate cytidylyltransferase [Acetobacter estunensis]|uniref:phosphatidate cytidylyltransferase n=1 Tax=Acetobacter estunensis TaxID=104097 RepID=UPI001C2D7BEA|nr:phosphatidate cytidylyltransferase [Acetobacter estunensis]